MSTVAFPVDTYREAATHLRRPFTVPAVRFRILQTKNGRSNCAAYIDARLVSERLNLVIPHAWTDAYVPVQGGMRCDLTVDGLTRSDVGWSKGTNSDMDLKALYSDALKRAGVKFGVGVSLYALPRLVISGDQVKTVGSNTYMAPSGEARLRSIYAQWLVKEGKQAFGEPLDHGDVERETEEEAAPAAVVEVPPPISAKESDYVLELLKTLKLPTRTLKALFASVGSTSTSIGVDLVRSLSVEQASELGVKLAEIAAARKQDAEAPAAALASLEVPA